MRTKGVLRGGQLVGEGRRRGQGRSQRAQRALRRAGGRPLGAQLRGGRADAAGGAPVLAARVRQLHGEFQGSASVQQPRPGAFHTHTRERGNISTVMSDVQGCHLNLPSQLCKSSPLKGRAARYMLQRDTCSHA